MLVSGSTVWRYKYHRDGKREKVTIGPYPAVGIKTARDRHEDPRVPKVLMFTMTPKSEFPKRLDAVTLTKLRGRRPRSTTGVSYGCSTHQG